MKRSANRTITSYFAKRANHEVTNESDAAASTSGAVATTTVNEEDGAHVRTAEDNNTASNSPVPSTFSAVTPLTSSVCIVQPPQV